jgi:hypothetical protein
MASGTSCSPPANKEKNKLVLIKKESYVRGNGWF